VADSSGTPPTADRPAGGGLENVVVGTSSISHVDGARGRLIYRGYDAAVLAEAGSFESVWYLLHHGVLPDAGELEAFRGLVRHLGTPSAAEASAVAGAAAATIDRAAPSPAAAVRSGLSALAGQRSLTPWLERPLDELRAEVLGLSAATAAVVVQAAAVLRGRAAPTPQGDSHAERYLHGLTGATPAPEAVRALDRYLSLTADHGMNASTFVARVVTSTGADAGAAVVAALGALSGPLHGGAPGPVLQMLDEIGRPDRARDWIARRIRDGHRIMGFGHRIYRTDDPRAMSLRRTAIESGLGRAELAAAVEAAALEVLAELKPGRPLRTNVEFWAAITLDGCGIPHDLFTATFTVSRVVGWAAHIVEQAADNRLIRPTVDYVGPLPDEARTA
jgi:citrate synthase